MYAKVDRSKVNECRSDANAVAQKKSSVKRGVGFVCNQIEQQLIKNRQDFSIFPQINEDNHSKLEMNLNSMTQRKRTIDWVGQGGVNEVTQMQKDDWVKIKDNKKYVFWMDGELHEGVAIKEKNGTVRFINALEGDLTFTRDDVESKFSRLTEIKKDETLEEFDFKSRKLTDSEKEIENAHKKDLKARLEKEINEHKKVKPLYNNYIEAKKKFDELNELSKDKKNLLGTKQTILIEQSYKVDSSKYKKAFEEQKKKLGIESYKYKKNYLTKDQLKNSFKVPKNTKGTFKQKPKDFSLLIHQGEMNEVVKDVRSEVENEKNPYNIKFINSVKKTSKPIISQDEEFNGRIVILAHGWYSRRSFEPTTINLGPGSKALSANDIAARILQLVPEGLWHKIKLVDVISCHFTSARRGLDLTNLRIELNRLLKEKISKKESESNIDIQTRGSYGSATLSANSKLKVNHQAYKGSSAPTVKGSYEYDNTLMDFIITGELKPNPNKDTRKAAYYEDQANLPKAFVFGKSSLDLKPKKSDQIKSTKKEKKLNVIDHSTNSRLSYLENVAEDGNCLYQSLHQIYQGQAPNDTRNSFFQNNTNNPNIQLQQFLMSHFTAVHPQQAQGYVPDPDMDPQLQNAMVNIQQEDFDERAREMMATLRTPNQWVNEGDLAARFVIQENARIHNRPVRWIEVGSTALMEMSENGAINIINNDYEKSEEVGNILIKEGNHWRPGRLG